ncbi:hypothetical protein [Photorhabdus temperata]|uniref:hypothetical protein n=1 Tax=Photorhabdus temperata TaxID=574560 RepID=UPI0005869022|nr:hypothetical protein [Photorhabdus temperata]
MRRAGSGLIAGLLIASASASAESAKAFRFKITSQVVPEITLFNPEATTAIAFRKTEIPDASKVDTQNYISICANGYPWVKGYKKNAKTENQKVLMTFFSPKAQTALAPNLGEDFAAIRTQLNTPYTLHLPLSKHLNTGETDFKTDDPVVTFGIRPAFPFANNCSPTAGVSQFLRPITIPVRSIADATPIIEQLVPTQQELAKDGKHFIAKVKILGVTKDTTVLWVDSNNPNGLPMARAKEIASQPDVEHGLTGKEVIGGLYRVSLPVPTTMTYSAKVKVTKLIKSQSRTFEEPMVNGDVNKPYLKVSDCTDNQCQIIWNSVIPYRDVNGSLGLSLQGNLPVLDKTQLPKAIFTLQRNSEWKQVGLFSGQTDAALAQSNWKLYRNTASPLLTSSPLPQKGVFLLNFETVAAP